LRAEAAMGAVIRSALARAGVDAASATRLAFAEEAPAPPVAILGMAELQREEGTAHRAPTPMTAPPANDFESKILAMTQRFAGGLRPDFANASFAELFAWSLARPEAGLPGPP
jgi:hypothetical protein